MTETFSAVFLSYQNVEVIRQGIKEIDSQLVQFTMEHITRYTTINVITSHIAANINKSNFAMFWTADGRNFYYMAPEKRLGHFMLGNRQKLYLLDIDGNIANGKNGAILHHMPNNQAASSYNANSALVAQYVANELGVEEVAEDEYMEAEVAT